MTENTKSRRIVFSFDNESREFERGLNRYLQSMVKIERGKLLPQENTEAYSHGVRWATYSGDNPGETNTMKLHSHEEIIKFSDIVENRIRALPEFVIGMVNDMTLAFQRTMYETVMESTDKTGNVVSAAGNKTNAQAFLEMLELIEFGVDKDGNPTMPEIHMAPDMADKFIKELDSQGEDYDKKVEDLKNKKSAEAVKKENKRLSKFKSI